MSLTVRILLGFILTALAAVYFLLNPVLDRVERQYLEAAEEPMVDTAEILAGVISQQIESTGQVGLSIADGIERAHSRELNARIYDVLKKNVDMDVYVTDASGVVVFDSESPENVGTSYLHLRDVFFTLKGEYGARSSRRDEADSTSSVMYVGAPIIVNDQIVGALSVVKPQKSMLVFIQSTRDRLRFFAGIGVAMLLIVGLLLSRWVTHPLRVLTRHAEAVSEGERPSPPAMPGYHLSVLGDSVESMRAALEGRKYVESYVQTLTHEMKGPVAAIRGAAELLDEDLPADRRHQFTSNIRSESIRLQNLTDQLLALSSLENRNQLESRDRVDLVEIARRVADHERSRGVMDGPDVVVTSDGNCVVGGEEFLIETAVSNLVRNAVDFSPAAGVVTVTIDGENAGGVVLAVEDDGPGVPDYATSRVFDRFYSLPRPQTGRKSSGLGLCFVQEVASLHHGEASIANRPETSGARAELRLPR